MLGLLLVTLVAMGLRWYYLCHAMVYGPVRGDAVQYYAYAWNLVHHGVFSQAHPGSSLVVSDSFRDPGYPVFLALWMRLFSDFSAWYAAVLLAQAMLGALTVTLLVMAARRWIADRWVLAAGLVIAAWPHSITIDSFLLSETLFGFLCALALLLASRALQRARPSWTTAAGLAFGMAALTNAILVPFGVLLAGALYLRRHLTKRAAAVLAMSALALPLAWGIRNAQLPSGPSSSGRAMINLVQGSWPTYHSAYLQAVSGDPEGSRIMHEIGHESDVMRREPTEGLRLMAHRMAAAPLHYVAWYLGKPALLWDWSIRMGQGDIYVYPTINSPMDSNPLLRAWVSICHGINTLLMLLAFAGCIAALVRGRCAPTGFVTGLLLVYVTVLYSVLQAEPRYSIPFRGMEILLACHALQLLVEWLKSRRAVPTRSVVDQEAM
jgi:4-amino-4-deoxy-L-arabinose transferase-like glycosyltransferase